MLNFYKISNLIIQFFNVQVAKLDPSQENKNQVAIFHKPLEALASGKFDIGQCKSVRVRCVSELGWHDTKLLIKDLKAGGEERLTSGILRGIWKMLPAAVP